MASPRPVVCSLDRHALSCRESQLRVSILADAQQVDGLPDGIRWTFRHAPDLFARLGLLLDGERQCCRFLHIAIAAEPDCGAVTVAMTGPPGTVEVLQGWIASPA